VRTDDRRGCQASKQLRQLQVDVVELGRDGIEQAQAADVLVGGAQGEAVHGSDPGAQRLGGEAWEPLGGLMGGEVGEQHALSGVRGVQARALAQLSVQGLQAPRDRVGRRHEAQLAVQFVQDHRPAAGDRQHPCELRTQPLQRLGHLVGHDQRAAQLTEQATRPILDHDSAPPDLAARRGRRV
jgi:hypothetical protein